MPGSSGSPVFSDEWQLVALHHAAEQAKDAEGNKIDLNGNPITDRTSDHLRNWWQMRASASPFSSSISEA
jgi:endonuclease G